MNDFAQRLAIGAAHELQVASCLTLYRWTVEPWGQGILPELIRAALQRTHSSLRWTPDLIAARGPSVVLVDAKTSLNPETGRFTISQDSLHAHMQFTSVDQTPIYYVIGPQYGVMTPNDVIASGAHLMQGQRGAYYLIEYSACRPFDSVFGWQGLAQQPVHPIVPLAA